MFYQPQYISIAQEMSYESPILPPPVDLYELQRQAERKLHIVAINRAANYRQAQVTRMALTQRGTKSRSARNFRDKFFEISLRRGVSTIDLHALAKRPAGARNNEPVILTQGPSPRSVLSPLKTMERSLPSYTDMTAITKYDSSRDRQIKWYIQQRDCFAAAALPAVQPIFVPSHVRSNYVQRKPVPPVDTVTVQGWINYAPCPAAPEKRAREDDSDGRQSIKRTRHSFSASTASCKQ